MRPQRVLMTTDAAGGVWTYSLELARKLGAAGVHTALACMGPRPSPVQRAEALNIPAVRLYESDYRLEWTEDPWDDVGHAGDWLLSIERKCSPDIVHLNGYVHGSLDWAAPVIMVAHSCVLSWWQAVHNCPAGSWPDSFHEYRDRVRRGLQAAGMVVAPSRAMLSSVERLYGPIAHTCVIPNGVSPEHYFPQWKEPFAITAGRLWDRAKNVDAVEQAAPGLPWPVYAAGDGQPGAGIRFLGNLPRMKLATWLGRASIFVLPAYYEPFGLTVLEAALSKCALVLGDLESLREHWNGAALFVPPNDPNALHDALRFLMSSADVLAALQSAALLRAQRFTARRMGAAYLNCYRRLMAQSRPVNQPAYSMAR